MAHYARVKIRGKIIRASLATGVFSTAKLKLIDLLKEQRENHAAEETPLFSKVAELYRTRVRQDCAMKQSSEEYRELIVPLTISRRR